MSPRCTGTRASAARPGAFAVELGLACFPRRVVRVVDLGEWIGLFTSWFSRDEDLVTQAPHAQTDRHDVGAHLGVVGVLWPAVSRGTRCRRA